MFDIILDWIIGPIMDFFFRRHVSGRWHFSHLLPLFIIACLGLWWLGEHWDSALLVTFGIAGTVIFGLLNVILWIPREMGENEDFRYYIAEKKRHAEETKDQAENESKKGN